jgi:hypothetical protein
MTSPDVFRNNLLSSNLKWKGISYQQLASGIKYNTYPKNIILFPKLFMNALPLKIYRREVGSTVLNCNSRTSLLKQFDNPGQTSVTSYKTKNGLPLTLDKINSNYDNNSCQNLTNPSYKEQTCQSFQSPEQNAKRRVRSAGMVRSKYNNISANYFTDTNQYLTSRNRTFQQNQYFHIRQGDPTATPGTLGAINNIYSGNSYNYCPKFKLIYPITYQYTWLDGTTKDVVIPVGLYSIDDFNNILNSTMLENLHYMITLSTNTPFFFLKFSYNGNLDRIVLTSTSMSTSIFLPGLTYNYPDRQSANWIVPSSSDPFNPRVILTADEIFKSGLGFSAGTYPSRGDNDRDQIILGQISPTLKTNYLPIYYKPNNPEFACQGAVSGSSFIARKKYNAITNAANKLRTTYGIQSGNALAYGVPGPGYTLKDRIGFPIIKTPVTTKNNDIKFCIINRTIRNMRNG